MYKEAILVSHHIQLQEREDNEEYLQDLVILTQGFETKIDQDQLSLEAAITGLVQIGNQFHIPDRDRIELTKLMKTWRKLVCSKKDQMAMEVYIKCTATTKMVRGLKRKTAYYPRLKMLIINIAITVISYTPQLKTERNT